MQKELARLLWHKNKMRTNWRIRLFVTCHNQDRSPVHSINKRCQITCFARHFIRLVHKNQFPALSLDFQKKMRKKTNKTKQTINKTNKTNKTNKQRDCDFLSLPLQRAHEQVRDDEFELEEQSQKNEASLEKPWRKTVRKSNKNRLCPNLPPWRNWGARLEPTRACPRPFWGAPCCCEKHVKKANKKTITKTIRITITTKNDKWKNKQ